MSEPKQGDLKAIETDLGWEVASWYPPLKDWMIENGEVFPTKEACEESIRTLRIESAECDAAERRYTDGIDRVLGYLDY